ncbi:hypothetical protein FRACYDRAFT_236548 [Fragilariopsis cylindrus CCMP1102]|uniref:Uncharacterized protein n=1 Tax=Fragilariopsis cylindrus CCMP1102 TaxID=635003 RepID=A0A1E7FJB0_9STRA|nr:hypothetical protein FRACYDRAFT_236548 [Fragilariopsis cylindrus CCMP1102]|eukprot:OEU18272.1 hypothetical protein FRACYDRAFT_236548 [Fragilariopsis cylindrus CCMP1102]
MTYQTTETTSLRNEADSNLQKEEESIRSRKWVVTIAAALLLGGGTMLVSSSTSNPKHIFLRSATSLNNEDTRSDKNCCRWAHTGFHILVVDVDNVDLDLDLDLDVDVDVDVDVDEDEEWI